MTPNDDDDRLNISSVHQLVPSLLCRMRCRSCLLHSHGNRVHYQKSQRLYRTGLVSNRYRRCQKTCTCVENLFTVRFSKYINVPRDVHYAVVEFFFVLLLMVYTSTCCSPALQLLLLGAGSMLEQNVPFV